MENRAAYILVGGFVLTLLATGIAFVIWLAKIDLDQEYRDYDVYFQESVSGLYKRSVVYFLGIPVGEVIDIDLLPERADPVRVRIRLRSDVQVHEGSVARLELQGFTGVTYIEISGGDPTKPLIAPPPGEENPVLPSEATALQAIFASAPNLVEEAIIAVTQVQKLLSDDNIAAVSGILNNTDTISANLAAGTQDLDRLRAELSAMIAEVTAAVSSFKQLADKASPLLDDEVPATLIQATETLAAAEALFANVNDLVDSNEEAVTQFVNGSLPEISRMIVDLRTTARGLARLVARIEQNPAGVLFGPKESVYDAESRRLQEPE